MSGNSGAGFGEDARALVVDDGPEGNWSRPPAFEAGGGGLVSTADDYLAFALALLAGGSCYGGRVLSRRSVTLMTSDHLSRRKRAVSGFRPRYFEDIWTAAYQAIDD
jgi:CubicO group peptidase (beta-lactamase class C family)